MAPLFQANFVCGLASARYARLRLPTHLSHTEFTETMLHEQGYCRQDIVFLSIPYFQGLF